MEQKQSKEQSDSYIQQPSNNKPQQPVFNTHFKIQLIQSFQQHNQENDYILSQNQEQNVKMQFQKNQFIQRQELQDVDYKSEENQVPNNMQNNEELIENKNQVWTWMPCSFYMKQIFPDKNIIWSLQPTVAIGIPNKQIQPKININIWMDRQFMYDEEIGWNWHKSWILPTFCIKLEIIDPETNESLNTPPNTYAQIYAVRAATQDLHNFHLIDIGIKGNSKISLENGLVNFSAIKFTSTSYNNDGNKFNIIVAIIIEEEDDLHPRIIQAKISPSIFVDSRKSARDKLQVKEEKISPFYELFKPKHFNKTLIKRTKKECESINLGITNDISGFTNYFTAPNIRNKVKHPIYLAYKFSNCVQILFNRDYFKDQTVDQIIYKSINLLLEHDRNQQNVKNKKSFNSIDKINCQAYLTLVIIASKNNSNGLMNKKIGDLLGQIDNTIINIIFDQSYLSDKFIRITDLELMRIGYERAYNYIQTYNLKDEADKSPIQVNKAEIEPPSEQPIRLKKIKLDKPQQIETLVKKTFEVSTPIPPTDPSPSIEMGLGQEEQQNNDSINPNAQQIMQNLRNLNMLKMVNSSQNIFMNQINSEIIKQINDLQNSIGVNQGNQNLLSSIPQLQGRQPNVNQNNAFQVQPVNNEFQPPNFNINQNQNSQQNPGINFLSNNNLNMNVFKMFESQRQGQSSMDITPEQIMMSKGIETIGTINLNTNQGSQPSQVENMQQNFNQGNNLNQIQNLIQSMSGSCQNLNNLNPQQMQVLSQLIQKQRSSQMMQPQHPSSQTYQNQMMQNVFLPPDDKIWYQNQATQKKLSTSQSDWKINNNQNQPQNFHSQGLPNYQNNKMNSNNIYQQLLLKQQNQFNSNNNSQQMAQQLNNVPESATQDKEHNQSGKPDFYNLLKIIQAHNPDGNSQQKTIQSPHQQYISISQQPQQQAQYSVPSIQNNNSFNNEILQQFQQKIGIQPNDLFQQNFHKQINLQGQSQPHSQQTATSSNIKNKPIDDNLTYYKAYLNLLSQQNQQQQNQSQQQQNAQRGMQKNNLQQQMMQSNFNQPPQGQMTKDMARQQYLLQQLQQQQQQQVMQNQENSFQQNGGNMFPNTKNNQMNN